MPTWSRKRPESVRRLVRQFRNHPQLQPDLGPALAAALMSRTPVRTVWRLARIAGRHLSTLDRCFARTAIAARAIRLCMLVDALLLIRVAEMPATGRTWMSAAAHLGVGEKRLRTACCFWFGRSIKAAALRTKDVVDVIEARLGLSAYGTDEDGRERERVEIDGVVDLTRACIPSPPRRRGAVREQRGAPREALRSRPRVWLLSRPLLVR